MMALALNWWKLVAGLILGALLCFPVAQCQGKREGERAAALRLEQANRRYLDQKARADDLASSQRLTDTIAVNRMERTLRDAIADTPDTAPDAVRVQLGCERLRQSGADSARLPAVCRSGG